jgi:hypothetical protein
MHYVEVTAEDAALWFTEQELDPPWELADELKRKSGPKAPAELPRAAAKSRGAEDRRDDVKKTIEALMDAGLWGVKAGVIAKELEIDDSTLYRYLRHETVKPTWDRYQRRSMGKPPAKLDELGDGPHHSPGDRA